MNKLNENKRVIKASNSVLYKLVFEEEEFSKINIKKDNGSYYLERNGRSVSLHSQYNISNEFYYTFNHVPEDVEILILFGIGDGSVLHYIKNKFKNLKKLIVIELSQSAFKLFLTESYLTEAVKNINEIMFIVNTKVDVANLLVYNSMKNTINVAIASLFSSQSIYESEYREVQEGLINNLTLIRSDMQTIALSTDLWAVNAISNMRYEAFDIHEIDHVFNGKPVVFVGAGPSLNKNIHLIEELKKHAVVIAGGSAIKILDSHGIIPHFRMAYDGLLREKEMLKGIDTTSCPIIFGSFLFKEILENYEAEKVRFILNVDYMSQFISKKIGYEPTLLDSLPTITAVGMSMAVRFGATDVILLGQDMSAKDGDMYASGSNLTNKIVKKHYIETTDINGETVYTNKSYLTMQYSFDEFMKLNPKVRFINSTEGGLGFKNAANFPLKETIEILNQDYGVLESQNLLDGIEKKSYFDKVKDVYPEIREQAKELMDLNNNRIKRLKKVQSLIEKKTSKSRIRNDLNSISKFDGELKKIELYREVVVPSLKKILRLIQFKYRDATHDEYENFDSTMKIALSTSYEVEKYLKVVVEIINESQLW